MTPVARLAVCGLALALAAVSAACNTKPIPPPNAVLAVPDGDRDEAAPSPAPAPAPTPAPAASAPALALPQGPQADEWRLALAEQASAAHALFEAFEPSDGGSPLWGLRLGRLLIVERPPLPAEVLTYATPQGRYEAHYAGALFESALGLWLFDAQSPDPLTLRWCDKRPGIGTPLVLAGRVNGRWLSLSARVAAAGADQERSPYQGFASYWLDRAQLPMQAPLLAFDLEGGLCGLVVPNISAPFMTLLDTQALSALIYAYDKKDLAPFTDPAYSAPAALAAPDALPPGSGSRWLGAQVRPLDAEQAKRFSLPPNTATLIVTAVYPHSPAQNAGLFVGDRLVGFGAAENPAMGELPELLNGADPQRPLALRVLRGDHIIELFATLAERRP